MEIGDSEVLLETVDALLTAGESGGVLAPSWGRNALFGCSNFRYEGATRLDILTVLLSSSTTTLVEDFTALLYAIGALHSPSSGVGVGGSTQTSGKSIPLKVDVVLGVGEGQKASPRTRGDRFE